MNRIWYCKISHIFPGLWTAKQSLKQPHEKNGLVLLQNVASTAVGTHGTPDGLKQAHERNGPVLLQNVAATPLSTHEHSRVHFFDPKTQNPA